MLASRAWSPRLPVLASLALLAGLNLLVYAPSLHAPFAFDDVPNILENPAVIQAAQGGTSLLSLARPELEARRPLAYLSFALNLRYFGRDPFSFHVVNLAIHILNSWLLFALLLRLGKIYPGHRVLTPALAGALLWSLHPVQTQAVTYLVQRMTSLASLFYLLSLLLWLQARVQSSRLARLGWILAGLGSAWLGFFTKEILLTLPLVVFLLEITVRGQGRSLRERRAWLVKALAALAGYGILLLLLVPRLNPDVTANVNRLSTQWTARLLTQPRVFWHYLSLLCFPDLSRLSLDPEWTLSQGWLSPGTTLPALLALAALLGLSLSWLGRRPVAALAVLFFLIALAPEAVVPLDPVFDHRLYLPSAGLLGGLGAGWLWPGPRRRARLALFFSSAVFLSCLSYARNATWAEGVRLWQDTVKKSPHKARVWNNLAVKYHARNWIARAVPAYQQAVRLDPDLAEAYQNLGLLYSRLGRVEDARRAAGRVLALKPGDPRALLLLAEVDERAGNRERALEDYRRAWESEPTNPEVLEQLGQGLMALGRPDLAQEVFEALTGLYPDRADAHLLLGNACFEQGRWAEAAAAYSRELERHPEATGVQNNLGMAWLRLHQPDRAAAAFARAASLEPGSALFQANLCEAEADLGQLEAATAACRKAVSLEPSLGFAWKLLANLYLRQGRDAEAQQALDQARKLGE